MLLLSTASLKGYGLHHIFALAKLSQYHGLSLELNHDDFDGMDADYINNLIQTFSFPVVSVTAFERKMNEDTMNRVIELAEKIHAQTVHFYPPHRFFDKNGEWFRNALPKIAKQKPHLHIATINVEPKTFLFVIPEYKDATLLTIKKTTGKTALHISNVNPESGIDLPKTFSMLGNSIQSVFISDK